MDLANTDVAEDKWWELSGRKKKLKRVLLSSVSCGKLLTWLGTYCRAIPLTLALFILILKLLPIQIQKCMYIYIYAYNMYIHI